MTDETCLTRLVMRWQQVRGQQPPEGLAAELLAELLLCYEEGYKAGQPVSAEELCRDCTELLPELRERIKALDAFEGLGKKTDPAEPSVPPSPPAEPRSTSCRYQRIRFHRPGGLGEIYIAYDEVLGREVALKFIRKSRATDPVSRSRLHFEGQVTSRLEHPNIIPVYGSGKAEDGRPFYSMKFVKGGTLAELLKERVNAADRLPEFLDKFGLICQAVAYAHSQRVIHRDLKPSNVMVGEFGEVQVMDWGLARFLDEPGGLLPLLPGPGVTGADFPRRTGQTASGAVLGTPGYMAPEQARGEGVDERCDVFSLGAILCEILTGLPLRLDRGMEDLAEALVRLGESGADEELVRLAQRCLAAEPAARPCDAGAVAQAVATYRAEVQERLRAAELDGAKAEARAAEAQARAEAEARARKAVEAQAAEAEAKAAAQRRARRRAVQLLLVVGLLVAVVGGGGWWIQREAGLRAQEAAEVQREFNEREPEARRLQAAGRYKEAEAVVQRLEGLIQIGAGGADLPARVGRLRAHLAMLADLEKARLGKAELDANRRAYDFPRAAPQYREAFRRYGLGVLTLGPAEVAAEVHASPIREALLAALVDWAVVTRDAGEQDHLVRVVAAVGPASGAFGQRWQQLVEAKDVVGLVRLACQADSEQIPPASVVRLSKDLSQLGAREEAIRLLRRAQGREPGDFWLNVELAFGLGQADPPQREEAVRFWMAAVGLRPQSLGTHLNLGSALFLQKDLAGAVQTFHEAIRLDPNYAQAHNGLGNALYKQKDLVGAIREYREAIRLDPKFASAHNNLGNALHDQNDLVGAIREYREAIRLDPNDATAHNNLGNALHDQNDLAGAVREHRKAIRLDPKFASAHNNLGNVLHDQNELAGAIQEYRKAIRLDPDYALAHYTRRGPS